MSKKPEKPIPAEEQTPEQRAERWHGQDIINEAALRSYKPSPERLAEMEKEKQDAAESNDKRKS